MLVFVHINKTAGTTVRYVLRSSYGSRHCDVEPWVGAGDGATFSAADLRRIRRLYPRLASIAGHRIVGYVDLEEPGLRYFTFLREPLATCASRFQYQLDHRGKRGLVFEEWIGRDWVRNAQTRRIGGTEDPADALRVIERREMFVGLAERFDESMVLLKALRAPDLDLSYVPVNVARRSDLAKELLADPRSRALLEEANRADLELYRQVREEVYPRLQREFGPALEEAVAAFRDGGRRGFNRWNLARYGVKQRLLFRPLVRLSRGRAAGRPVEGALGGG